MNKTTTEPISSIDIFRGLTILTMVFVNDLASIRNIPAWMKHAPTEADAMTFVDLVFLAFFSSSAWQSCLPFKSESTAVKPLRTSGNTF